MARYCTPAFDFSLRYDPALILLVGQRWIAGPSEDRRRVAIRNVYLRIGGHGVERQPNGGSDCLSAGFCIIVHAPRAWQRTQTNCINRCLSPVPTLLPPFTVKIGYATHSCK